MMEEGVNQGCPLLGCFAALVLNEILSELVDRLMTARAEERLHLGNKGDDNYGGRTHQSGFIDDVGAVVPIVVVKPVFSFVHGPIYPAATPEYRSHHRTLADELANTIAEFSVKPSTTPEQFDPVEVADGFVYLGCPIGSPDFARSYFKEKVNEASELVEDIEELLRLFLSELLDEAEIPDHTILICQLGLKQGGLGLLHPALRAVLDFIVSMNKAQFSARNGFKIWKDAVPVKLHPSLT
ncbi:hypothetical protein THAOC_32779, partial [Thalassiosira oceanica]